MANQFDLRKFLNENKLTRAGRALNENEVPTNEAMNNYGGGDKGANEFIAAAENGVGIADYLKGVFANYNNFYGDALQDEGIFYEYTPEDEAILRAIGRSDLLG
jgi:hypothetical protein